MPPQTPCMILRMALFWKVDLLKISYWSCWLFEKAEISSSILSPTSTAPSFPVGVVADIAAVVCLRAITEGTSCIGVSTPSPAGTGATPTGATPPSPEWDAITAGTGATPPSPERGAITAGTGANAERGITVKVAGIGVARMGANPPSAAVRTGSVAWLGSAEEVVGVKADAVIGTTSPSVEVVDKAGAASTIAVSAAVVSGSVEANGVRDAGGIGGPSTEEVATSATVRVGAIAGAETTDAVRTVDAGMGNVAEVPTVEENVVRVGGTVAGVAALEVVCCN